MHNSTCRLAPSLGCEPALYFDVIMVRISKTAQCRIEGSYTIFKRQCPDIYYMVTLYNVFTKWSLFYKMVSVYKVKWSLHTNVGALTYLLYNYIFIQKSVL
jgi:hypothetical protein